VLRLIARLLLATTLAAGAGCAGAPARPQSPAPQPELQLAPAALPGGLALQQRLTFQHGERSDTFDALVEADAQSLRIVVHAQGQVALRVAWDGATLAETRAAWLPPELRSARVLGDLQFVFWPADAIAAALPPGWRLHDADGGRNLYFGDELVARATWPSAGVAVLQNRRDGYTLRIQSQPVTP
jgi:hypothetical protein